MWKLFDGNPIALVTGGSRGIGKSIALELAKNGVEVIVNYAHNENAAQNVCEQIINTGGKSIAIKANVMLSNEVDEMFRVIREKYGKLNILINNAGIVDDGFVMQMSLNKFKKIIETNLYGCFYVTKSALFFMASKKQDGGTIINIASTSGIVGQEGQGNYSASKGAIIAFSKVLAKEYASKNIRCNVVAPGFIQTDMTAYLKNQIKEKYMKFIPMGHFGRPEDVANAVCFLASKKSEYITGKVLTVDGGMIT